MRNALPSVLAAATVAACTGKLTYSPPGPAEVAIVTATLDRPRPDAWRLLIPELAKTFFVINNLDQSSGLVNVSYSGDPEQFVDCGRITSRVTNLQGARVYDFPASRAQQTYEVRNESGDYGQIERTMSLEGRINLVLEDIPTSRTRLTANVRYVLTRRLRIHSGRAVQDYTDTIRFGSGERASFPRPRQGMATVCHATGGLERQLLQLVSLGEVPN